METKVTINEISINLSTLENLKKGFIAFDLETTGFSPYNDRIVEIGAIRFVNGRAKETFDTLVHSDVPISRRASQVNGITNEMLSTAPDEAEAIFKLIEFLGDALQGKTALCAHNASFDMKFLQASLNRFHINAEIYCVDTLSLARTHIKGLDNYKQDTVLKHFNFSNIQAHRAQADALGCGKILCKLFPALESHIEKIEQPPKRKLVADKEIDKIGDHTVRRLKIYLDTSVISHLQQEDAPEKMRETLELWEQFREREDVSIVISDLVVREISQCKEPKRSFLLDKMVQLDYTLVNTTNEERQLSNIYLKNGVLREKSLDDLTHIAIATLSDCRYIVSWNFKHFVNPKTIKAVNAINLSLNLPPVDIYSPSMMLGGF